MFNFDALNLATQEIAPDTSAMPSVTPSIQYILDQAKNQPQNDRRAIYDSMFAPPESVNRLNDQAGQYYNQAFNLAQPSIPVSQAPTAPNDAQAISGLLGMLAGPQNQAANIASIPFAYQSAEADRANKERMQQYQLEDQQYRQNLHTLITRGQITQERASQAYSQYRDQMRMQLEEENRQRDDKERANRQREGQYGMLLGKYQNSKSLTEMQGLANQLSALEKGLYGAANDRNPGQDFSDRTQGQYETGRGKLLEAARREWMASPEGMSEQRTAFWKEQIRRYDENWHRNPGDNPVSLPNFKSIAAQKLADYKTRLATLDDATKGRLANAQAKLQLDLQKFELTKDQARARQLTESVKTLNAIIHGENSKARSSNLIGKAQSDVNKYKAQLDTARALDKDLNSPEVIEANIKYQAASRTVAELKRMSSESTGMLDYVTSQMQKVQAEQSQVADQMNAQLDNAAPIDQNGKPMTPTIPQVKKPLSGPIGKGYAKGKTRTGNGFNVTIR